MSFIDHEIEHGVRVTRQPAVKCFSHGGSTEPGQADEFAVAQVVAQLNTGTALVEYTVRIKNAVHALRIPGVGHIARRPGAGCRYVGLGKILMLVIDDRLDRSRVAGRE